VEKSFASTVAKAGFKCIVYEKPGAMRSRKYKRSLDVLVRSLDKWIPTLPQHTAVLCMHDFRASHFLYACLRHGRAVPNDIAIMGQYNDVAFCACSPVTITSVDVNPRAFGEAAMRILDNAIDNPVEPKLRPTFFVPPVRIVERESTAVYPVTPPWLAKCLLILDANLDKSIDVSDAVLVAKFSSGDSSAHITDHGLVNADCDGKKGVDSDDITIILKFIAKLIDENGLKEPQ
jgi:pimeloyl-ACP methyl ester carboxylesterase